MSVDISDEKAGGIFSSGIKAALRTLPDVQVVAIDDEPDVSLRGAVVCVGATDNVCRDPLSYSVAFDVVRPLRRSDLILVLRLGGLATSARHVPIDSAFRYLKAYGVPGTLWVASWGRGRYEQAMREYVSQLDAECLEQFRLIAKIGKLTDGEREKFAKANWSC